MSNVASSYWELAFPETRTAEDMLTEWALRQAGMPPLGPRTEFNSHWQLQLSRSFVSSMSMGRGCMQAICCG